MSHLRRWFFDTAEPVPESIDETLVAFVVEALGQTMAQMTRTPEEMSGARPEDRVPHAASSADMQTVRRWRYMGGECSVHVERTLNFFPGDVNEAPRSSENIRVDGKRRDERLLVVHVRAGESGLWMDVLDDEFLTRATRAFGPVTRTIELSD